MGGKEGMGFCINIYFKTLLLALIKLYFSWKSLLFFDNDATKYRESQKEKEVWSMEYGDVPKEARVLR